MTYTVTIIRSDRTHHEKGVKEQHLHVWVESIFSDPDVIAFLVTKEQAA